jgi:hypothetical protein
MKLAFLLHDDLSFAVALAPLPALSPRWCNKASTTRGERVEGVHPPQWQWFCPSSAVHRRSSSTAHGLLWKTGHCYGGREGTCTFYATLGLIEPAFVFPARRADMDAILRKTRSGGLNRGAVEMA